MSLKRPKIAIFTYKGISNIFTYKGISNIFTVSQPLILFKWLCLPGRYEGHLISNANSSSISSLFERS